MLLTLFSSQVFEQSPKWWIRRRDNRVAQKRQLRSRIDGSTPRRHTPLEVSFRRQQRTCQSEWYSFSSSSQGWKNFLFLYRATTPLHLLSRRRFPPFSTSTAQPCLVTGGATHLCFSRHAFRKLKSVIFRHHSSSSSRRWCIMMLQLLLGIWRSMTDYLQ